MMLTASLYTIAAVLFVWTLMGGLGGQWSPNHHKRWHGRHKHTHQDEEARGHNPLDTE